MPHGAKSTKPGRGSKGNKLGGGDLNQSGFGGGAHRQKPGSLNLKGFGSGQNSHGCCKGMDSKPIPTNEQ